MKIKCQCKRTSIIIWFEKWLFSKTTKITSKHKFNTKMDLNTSCSRSRRPLTTYTTFTFTWNRLLKLLTFVRMWIITFKYSVTISLFTFNNRLMKKLKSISWIIQRVKTLFSMFLILWKMNLEIKIEIQPLVPTLIKMISHKFING